MLSEAKHLWLLRAAPKQVRDSSPATADQNDITKTLRNSFRNVFRLRCQCLQEWGPRKRQSPEQISERKRRIGFQSCLIVHAGDTRQLSLEMRNRTRRWIV